MPPYKKIPLNFIKMIINEQVFIKTTKMFIGSMRSSS
jgi:hypothetical protein